MSAVLDGASPPGPNEDPCDELNAIVLNATKAAKELGEAQGRHCPGHPTNDPVAVRHTRTRGPRSSSAPRPLPARPVSTLASCARHHPWPALGGSATKLCRRSRFRSECSGCGRGRTQAPRERCRCGLFDGDGLGQVAGLVDVVASGLGDRRREYLQWNRGQQRLEKR